MRRTLPSAPVRVVLMMVVMCLALLALPALANAAPPLTTVSGTVTDAANGVHLSNITVTAHYWDGAAWTPSTSDATDYDGRYVLSVPQGDSYRILFLDEDRLLYTAEFWNDRANVFVADSIAVDDTPVTGIDAALARWTGTGHGGSITGRVMAEGTGWDPGSIEVSVWRDNGGVWEFWANTLTGSDGVYLLSGLPADSYVVRFRDYDGIYQDGYYNSRADEASADPVVVGEDADVRSIDATMRPFRSAIAGTVRDEVTGIPVPGVYCYLYRDGGYYGYYLTDQTGHYIFTDLPAGDYIIQYADSASLYYFEWWHDAATDVAATAIPLDGVTDYIYNLDAEIALGGIISGTVTAGDTGEPLPDASVTAYSYNATDDAWYWAGAANTDAAGQYMFSALDYGPYRVQFQDGSGVYLSEYYSDSPGLLDATNLVTSASPLTDIDAALDRGASVTGSVIDDVSGLPLVGTSINVMEFDPNSGNWDYTSLGASTNGSGVFTIFGMPYGTYRFVASTAGHVAQWWQNAATAEEGTSWVFADATPQTGLDFALVPTGMISGHVSNVADSPLYAIYVQAWQLRTDWDGDSYWTGTALGTNTGVGGDYTITNVPPGTYRVWFYDSFAPAPAYLSEFYPEKPNAWVAEDVIVGAGAAVTNIDAHLSAGANISGTVTDAGALPLQDVAVRAFAYDPSEDDWKPFGSSVYTDASGNYTLTGLADDEYRVGFYKWNYRNRYYAAADDVFSATGVTIVNGTNVPGTNVTLIAGSAPPGGTISGVVTSDDTGLGVAEMRVVAYRSDPISNGGWYWANSTLTSASGAYSMSAPAGVYRLEFADGAGTIRYLSEYYNDRATAADADHLTLASGGALVANASVATGGAISGTITAQDTGLPLTNSYVTVYGKAGPDSYYAGSVYADSNGDYTVGGLRTGSYRVVFSDGDGQYREEYYDNAGTAADATAILLDAGEVRSDIDAALAHWGGISGTVTGDDGRPVDQMAVNIYRRGVDTWDFVDQRFTARDGTYSFTNVNPGEYIVQFFDSGAWGFDRYFAEYHSNTTQKGSATTVSVGFATVTVDEGLTSTGTWGDISGTVTDAVSGDPVPGIAVCRHNPDGGGGWSASGFNTETSADGTYMLQWVPVGTDYRVVADPDEWVEAGFPWSGIYNRTFHDADATASDGLPVEVVGGVETTAIDIDAAPLANIGYVSGHVIEDGTGADVANAAVSLWLWSGGYSDYAQIVTDENGRFSRPVVAGQYAIGFNDWPAHQMEVYEDVDGWAPDGGTPVFVTATASTEITASLQALGSISGLVTSESSGDPISGVQIDVYRQGSSGVSWMAQTATGPDGTYTIEGLEYGAGYLVVFTDGSSQFVSEAFDNKPDLYSADPIAVGASQVTGIDAALADAATISGIVTDAQTHTPVSDAWVSVYEYDKHNLYWAQTHGAYTDAAGMYTVGGMPSGTYRVEFGAWNLGYAYEYYDNVRDMPDATNLAVTTGQDILGIDAALEKRGSISGTVTDVVTSNPIASASIYAYRYLPGDGTWEQQYSTSTNGSGQYTLTNLTPGTYRLMFYRSGYITEFRHNVYEVYEADDVVIGNGDNLTGIDEALSHGTTISGTVRNGAGEGVASVLVKALQFDARYGAWRIGAASSYTNASGQYTLSGLGDYDYRVVFTDPSARYMTEYYDDAATPEAGTAVSVIDAVPVASIDATLAPRVEPQTGTLAGIVRTDISALPIAGIEVNVARFLPEYGDWQVVEIAETAADGTYSVPLDVGTYRIEFQDSSGTYLGEYYHNHAGTYWDADDVAISADTTTTVNEGLVAAAHLRGTVRAETVGAPIANAVVDAYRINPESGWDWAAESYTGADGTYDCAGLPAGDYILYFMDPSEAHLPEYYDNVRDMPHATWISLAASQDRTGLDAALASAGTVGGTVTDEVTGRPVEGLRVEMYRDDGYGTYTYETTWSDESGAYLFDGLENATYYVEFIDSDSPTGYERFKTEYYDDAASLSGATPIVIAHQQVVADAQLASTGTWGSVAGTVTDEVNGEPVGNMRLDLYAWTGSEFVFADLSTVSASDGTYEFPYVIELAGAAPYRLLADPTTGSWDAVYTQTSHINGTSVDDGQNIALIADAHLTGIDVHMNRKPGVGWLTGTVESDETSAPLAGIVVDVYDTGGGYANQVTTQADGTWGLILQPGSYLLRFTDPTGTYAPEWYDESNQAGAIQVDVAADGTMTVDESLALAGHITGTVRTSGGQPLETWVSLFDASDGSWLAEVASTDGGFAFDGLRAGAYSIWFGSTGDYLGEYWNDRRNYGDEITVTSGQTTGDIDAVLMEGGRISGTVTSDDGSLYGDVYVAYYSHEPMGWEWTQAQWVYEGAGWSFTSATLNAGDYRIGFWDDMAQYQTTFYHGNASVDDASSVPVAEAGTTSVELVFDGLPPEVNTDAVASYDNLASIEISATDLVSGVGSITYDLDGDGAVTVSADTTTVAVSGWGDHYLYYWATDNFGHESDTAARVDFTIADTLAPEVDSDALATYDTTATVTITATDEVDGSGVASVSYKLDAEDTQTVLASSAQVEVGGIGDHTLVYWAEDNAGNESTHWTDEIAIADTEPPTVHDDAVASYNDSAAVHLTATDNAGGSGVDYITYSLDGGTWVVDPGPAVTVTVTGLGDHTLSYKAVDLAGNESAVTDVDFSVIRTSTVVEVPIAGTNRYTTAVEISKAAFPTGSDWVVIATGNNWPDALGGSALAGALDGPILLTDTNVLPAEIIAEIDRLNATDAIILGGTAAVGTPVETALNALLGDAHVERLAGTNRYLTADLVGARTIDELGTAFDGTAFVATGANYPDALAAAPLSAGLHWPLFLTKPTGLDAGTMTAMTGVDHALILGGIAVVPTAVETQLNTAYGDANVDRIAGANRYATAVAVATYGVNNGLHWDGLAIATGEKFPDALAGGVLQGRDGSVMLLTPTATLDSSVAGVLAANKTTIAEVRYLGGLNAVSQAVRDAVIAALD